LRPPAPPREGLASRDLLSRDAAALRSSSPPREGLASRDLLSRDAMTSRPPAPPREGLASREPLTRDAGTLRSPTPQRERLALRDALASRGTADAGPRSLLDETADLGLSSSRDLGLSPSRETISRREASPARAPFAPPLASGPDTTKRKKRSSEVFEGDAALKELRTRLAMAPTDLTPEPPLAPAKTPIFGSAVRLLGVVGLAAGGALGFMWITSPHGPRSAALPQAAEEVALVSLRPVEPSKPSVQNLAVQTPAPPPSAATPPSRAPQLVVAQTPPLSANEALRLGVSLDGPGDGAVLLVGGLAPGSTFSVGRSIGGNWWRLSAAELGNAILTPPRGFAGIVVLTMELRLPNNTVADRKSMRLEWAAPRTVPEPAVAERRLGADAIASLLKRGQQFLTKGDLAAARSLFERAAEAGDAQAAFALAETYDPIVLQRRGEQGFAPDISAARTWYERAREFGSSEASQRLQMLASQDK
jgi:hypothetical protein